MPSYRKSAQPGREFITHSPEARLAAQVLKRCIDQTDEGMGSPLASPSWMSCCNCWSRIALS
jgi:hypothetical protein